MPETNTHVNDMNEAVALANSASQNTEMAVLPPIVEAEPNPIEQDAPETKVRMGRVAAVGAAVATTAAAIVGPNIVGTENNGENNPGIIQDAVEQAEEQTPEFVPTDETMNVRVKPGDGVNDVVERAYGVEAPEGANQVVENNPAYNEQYQAVVDANGGSEELSPGKLPLPEDFLSPEEIDNMQINQPQ